MKALLGLTLAAGMLMTSTSNAFCLKQFSKSQNRFAASLERTNYQPPSVKKANAEALNSLLKPGAARK